jgi:poly(hydroxyalkanoate) granule-associated protein
MAGDAQDRATGLLDQVRGKSRLDKLQSAFDTRVADTMDRLNVPSKNDIDAINRKLNKIIRLLDKQGKPAAKKKTTRKRTTKKTAAKKKAATRKKT